MNTYLRILAVFYLYGALVHLADLLSLSHHLGQTHGLAFPEMSLPWQIGTVGFAAVDLVAAAGGLSGTQPAAFIKASGQEHRAKRPNT